MADKNYKYIVMATFNDETSLGEFCDRSTLFKWLYIFCECASKNENNLQKFVDNVTNELHQVGCTLEMYYEFPLSIINLYLKDYNIIVKRECVF